MSQPASNKKNEPSKMDKLLNGKVEDSIKARLPRGSGSKTSAPAQTTPASPSPEAGFQPRYKFLPAFWTFTGILSLIVNLVLIVILLLVLVNLGTIQLTANDQVSGLLGGLYNNFVKMDDASIVYDVPVNTNIPLNIVVPVQTTTRITLAENVTIPNAHVRINSGSLIIDSNAEVTLPAGTPLLVNLDFQLNVQNSVPIQLNVPVNIPLAKTELHEPFVGLQKVVEPFYCLVEPNAVVNNVNICSPTANLQIPTEQATP